MGKKKRPLPTQCEDKGVEKVNTPDSQGEVCYSTCWRFRGMQCDIQGGKKRSNYVGMIQLCATQHVRRGCTTTGATSLTMSAPSIKSGPMLSINATRSRTRSPAGASNQSSDLTNRFPCREDVSGRSQKHLSRDERHAYCMVGARFRGIVSGHLHLHR